MHSVSNKKGFSLIEILIAIAIVSFMMAVIAPAMYNWLGFGQKSQTRASIKGLNIAIIHYHLETGTFPETLQDLVRRPSDERAASKWNGPYIEGDVVPYDGWGNPFVYRKKPGSRPPYEIYSYGSDEGPDTPKEKWIR